MDAGLATTILEKVKETPLPVRELAQSIQRRTLAVTSTLKEMEDHGLIERRVEKNSKRGRPREVIEATLLGAEYLDKYRNLKAIPFAASPAMLRRAAEEGDYARRLAERGSDTFQLFLELNKHVRVAASTK